MVNMIIDINGTQHSLPLDNHGRWEYTGEIPAGAKVELVGLELCSGTTEIEQLQLENGQYRTTFEEPYSEFLGASTGLYKAVEEAQEHINQTGSRLDSYVLDEPSRFERVKADVLDLTKSQITQESDKLETRLTDYGNQLDSYISQEPARISSVTADIENNIASQVVQETSKISAEVGDLDNRLSAYILTEPDRITQAVTDANEYTDSLFSMDSSGNVVIRTRDQANNLQAHTVMTPSSAQTLITDEVNRQASKFTIAPDVIRSEVQKVIQGDFILDWSGTILHTPGKSYYWTMPQAMENGQRYLVRINTSVGNLPMQYGQSGGTYQNFNYIGAHPEVSWKHVYEGYLEYDDSLGDNAKHLFIKNADPQRNVYTYDIQVGIESDLQQTISTQITQVEDNISLALFDDKSAISRLNIGQGGITLSGDLVYIDSPQMFANNIITDRAIAWDAKINGAKIADATIGSAKIANMDVDKLTGNLTNFFRSNWNSATGGNVAIDGNGIVSTASDGSQIYIQDGIVGARNPSGASLGSIGYKDLGQSPHFAIATTWGSHFSVFTNPTREADFLAFNIQGDARTWVYTEEFRHGGSQAIFEGLVRANGGLNAGAHRIYGYGVDFHYGGSVYALSSNSTLRIDSTTRIQMRTGTNQFAFELDSTYAYMHRTLSMEGNNITNQSDERLKFNIEETSVNSLEDVKSMTFVEFDRTNGNHDEIGVIAQDTPSLALYDSERDMWSINSSKQIMMNSHAIQQLYFEFDERVESNESKIHILQQELSKANRRIEELGGAI